jgi:predicted MPP superfamily phosphohydrolase
MYIRGYWAFLLVFFLLTAILADLVRVLNYFYDIFPGWVLNHYTQVKFFYFLIVLSLSIIITTIGFIGFSNPQAVDLKLSVDKKNCFFEDLNVVAASDLHIGALIGEERLIDWIAVINRQDPDIILLVGDIFDRSFRYCDPQDIISELSTLKSKFGVFAVLGNHEYYFNIKKSIDYLEQAGITLLRDQCFTIDNKLVIIGRDDAYNNKRKTIDSLIIGVDNSLPVILMDHQPYDLSGAIKNKIDLYISGHTHNGQIFPGNIFAKSLWELAYGYRKICNSHFYVSSGLGLIYIPVRLGTQSEIVRISLKGKKIE